MREPLTARRASSTKLVSARTRLRGSWKHAACQRATTWTSMRWLVTVSSTICTVTGTRRPITRTADGSIGALSTSSGMGAARAHPTAQMAWLWTNGQSPIQRRVTTSVYLSRARMHIDLSVKSLVLNSKIFVAFRSIRRKQE